MRKSQPKKVADPRIALLKRYLGVPTEFFNVFTDGRRATWPAALAHLPLQPKPPAAAEAAAAALGGPVRAIAAAARISRMLFFPK